MNEPTHASILEIQATLQAMLYAQAQIISKMTGKKVESIFDGLMDFKNDMFNELATPTLKPEEKETD